MRPAPGVPLPAPATLPWTTRPADQFQLWALQTALHAIDELVVPDGRWNAAVPAAPARDPRPPAACPTSRAWTPASGTTPTCRPASGPTRGRPGGPTEADLVERIVGMATVRPGGVGAGAVSGASVALPAGAARVDVAVHRRALLEAPAADVAVLLLRLPLPTGVAPNPSPADWAAIAVPALPGLAAAMAGVGAGGGPLPGGVTLPGGWDAPDTTTQIRRPAGRSAPPRRRWSRSPSTSPRARGCCSRSSTTGPARRS